MPPVGDPEKLNGLTRLSTAVSNLQQAIRTGMLKVTVASGPPVVATNTSTTCAQRTMPTTLPTQVNPKSSGMGSRSSPPTSGGPRISPTVGRSSSSDSGYSGGAMAGLAIGMLLLGALLGSFAVFLVQRQLRSGSVSYKQELK